MALTRMIIVIAAAAALFLNVATSVDDLCKFCNCTPDVIDCTCKEKKVLDFSHKFTMSYVTLIISDCNTVRFEALMGLEARRVDVTNVSSLEVEDGAFKHVGDLKIRQVANLRLGKGTVTSLLVEDSRMQSVGCGAALTRVRRSLELTRVTIGVIYESSFFPGIQDTILIRDSEIMNIQRNAVKVYGEIIVIENCIFRTAEEEGVKLSSWLFLRLTNNSFRELKSPSSLKVFGDEVNVTGNKFNLFPNSFLKMKFKEFAENEIQTPLSSLPLETLDLMTEDLYDNRSYNNSFPCEGSDAFGRNLTLIYNECQGYLVQNTFCISPESPRSITHDQMLHEFRSNWTRCSLDYPFISTSSGDHPLTSTVLFWLLLVPASLS